MSRLALPVGLVLTLAPSCAPVCDRHTDCARDELCYQGSCLRALDRTYRFALERGRVGPLHPDGAPWDADGGPPDLLVELGTQDEACLTTTEWDDFTPTWAQTCDLWLSERWPLLYLDLWDQDDSIDELVTGWTWDDAPDLVDLARQSDQVLRVEAGDVWVEFWLSPVEW